MRFATSFIQRSCAIILTDDAPTTVVLQERNNIPTITLPGMYCHFGKIHEEGENFRTAAANALRDEVGIDVRPDDLQFLDFEMKSTELLSDEQDSIHAVFLVRGIKQSDCKLGQGRAIRFLPLAEAIEHPKLTPFTRRTLQKYRSQLEMS